MKTRTFALLLALLLLLPSCGGGSEAEADINPALITDTAGKFNILKENFLSDMKVCLAVVPQKSYYTSSSEYDAITEIINDTIREITPIDLTSALNADSYYSTDAHWRQEKLDAVMKIFGENFGFDYDSDRYAIHEYPDFRGYSARADSSLSGESLFYLTSDAIDGCRVSILDGATSAFIPSSVYPAEMLEHEDAYDVFLSGAVPVVTIENDLAGNNRELFIFRDSFGSSLAPLFIDYYSKITVIDVRYIASPLLRDYVSFTPGSDALIVYGTEVLKSGTTLKVW